MKSLLLCLLLWPLSALATDAEMGDDPIEAVFRVGVLANHGVGEAKQRWQPMMNYLSDRVPGIRFEVEPLDFDAMRESLLDLRIQFIVTNPGQYLSLSNEMPLSWLATMRSRKHNGATYAIGSTIIVRSDSPVQHIEQLEGARIVASDPQALGGYQATIGLLNRRGLDARNFFADVRFLGFPLEPLVYQVRDGMVDGAITPYCTLEEMVDSGLVRREDFRVLNSMRPEGYDCEISTSLYPNWSFAASDKVPARITQMVTKALFELPSDSEAAIRARTLGWTAPISQLTVIRLYEELLLHGNSTRPLELVRAWLKANLEYAVSAVLFLFGGMVYHLWLEYKFRQKSDSLIAAERTLRDRELMLERMQSAAILGEIGAGLAHELNQPIAAITQYSEGGLMALKQEGQASTEQRLQEVEEVLGKINRQSMRAGAVVHRIRSLLRRRRANQEAVYMSSLLSEAQALFQRPFEQQRVQLILAQQGEERPLFGDAVGLSQLLVNLLKNALDAMDARPDGRQIQITLDFDASKPGSVARVRWLRLEVLDNGSGLKAEAAELMLSFATTKEEGLGLGLAICRDVVNQHGGHIQLENRRDGPGCRVTVWLPLMADEEPV